MINGETSTGFAFEVPDDIGRDWRLLDAVDDAQSDNKLTRLKGVRSVCKLILGEDGYKALQTHLAEESGVVDASAMEREILEIFRAVSDGGDLKN